MDNYRLLPFATQAKWATWLEKNHAKAPGVWIKFYKKATGKKSITYSEALDEALCYGWIDGQVKSIDAESFKQKFTPRRARSLWSKRNTEHIARLIKLKKMKPAGLVQVKAAKKDGRWEAAYHSQTTGVIPPAFIKQLKKNKKAYDFYKTLKKSNLYTIIWQLTTAKKQETIDRRTKLIIQQLAKGQAPSFY